MPTNITWWKNARVNSNEYNHQTYEDINLKKTKLILDRANILMTPSTSAKYERARQMADIRTTTGSLNLKKKILDAEPLYNRPLPSPCRSVTTTQALPTHSWIFCGPVR